MKTLRMGMAAMALAAVGATGCASRTYDRSCPAPAAPPCYVAAVSATPISTAVPATTAAADTVSATMYRTTDRGPGEKLGTVTFADAAGGLEIRVDLADLPSGEHGFHVHEKPDCAPMMQDGKMGHALAAGGHFDPDKTGKHLGPGGGGHKGDLPRLVVGADGRVKTTMTLAGVKASDFRNRSLMIHYGGDNYSDTPVALGGGGARIACGIIQ